MVFGYSGGNYRLVNNTAQGGFGGFTLHAPCEAFLEWGGNVAMSNAVGFDVEAKGACGRLRLEGYRNSAGITAATPEIGNFLMVENGMAVTTGIWQTWPSQKMNLPGDKLGGGPEVGRIFDGTIIGRTPQVDGSVRSGNCQKWSAHQGHPWSRGYKIGGTMCQWRWFTEYGYSGFAAQGAYVIGQGSGYDDLKWRPIDPENSALKEQGEKVGFEVGTFRYLVDNVEFSGFSGTDSCGRRNVAISNEMAGDGEGAVTSWVGQAHYGKATCYPIEVRNLSFVDTPDYARLRFSRGPKEQDVQFGLCTVHDWDGSLLGEGSKWVDPGIGPYFLKPTRRHEWPTEVLRDCQSWAETGYADDYEMGTCLWWLRKYDNMRGAITDPSKRGVLRVPGPGTQNPQGICAPIFTDSGTPIDSGVELCSGLDYVVLKTFVPEKRVSGSEVLYGPVGYINSKDAFFGSSNFAGDDTAVDIYRDYTDPRGEQMPPQTGKETEKFEPVLERYTQPYLATLVNQAYYRIEYTGDITLFNEDFLEYRLFGLTDMPRISEEYAVVLDVKFMKAVNLGVYYEGRQVKAAPRRDLLSLASPAGLSYMNPVSKILSFVVKGTSRPVRIRQLDVVSVAFGVAVSFDSFFEVRLTFKPT